MFPSLQNRPLNISTARFAPVMTDLYKLGHAPQYPEGTEEVYANLTGRTGKYAPEGTVDTDHYVWFGAQIYAIDFLLSIWGDFFKMSEDEAVEKYQRYVVAAVGPNIVDPENMRALHKLGYLPLHIKTLPEGSRVPYKVTPFTIVNTHKKFPWLPLYIESASSSYLWNTCTSATTAYNARQILNFYVGLTGGSYAAAQFQLHDFSLRGRSNPYDGYISCLGHLVASAGSDTFSVIHAAEMYNLATPGKDLIAGGVPATEHSVMSMGIGDGDKYEGEKATFKRLLTETYPTGLVSIVSDTNDYWLVLTKMLPELKPIIMARQKCSMGFCKTVIRPDSGDPFRVICGYDATELRYHGETQDDVWKQKYEVVETGEVISYAEKCGSLWLLWNTFRGTVNDKGYRVLDEHIGLIYGDSITLKLLTRILKRMEEDGWCANNVVFGLGSYTYQYVTRDTHGFAFKATYGIVNGVPQEISKDPATDKGGMKKSARGLIRVDRDEDGEFFQTDQCTPEEEMGGELTTLFYNGVLVKQTNLTEIRETLGVF